MNIKLKALLIAIAIITGIFGFIYALVFYPLFILACAGISLVYLIYRLVLSSLEHKEKWKI